MIEALVSMSNMFLIQGNICGERVRLARTLHNPPLTQEELAQMIQLQGFTDMTRKIIFKIERGNRHVIDAELRLLAQTLEVSMEWLVGDVEVLPPRK